MGTTPLTGPPYGERLKIVTNSEIITPSRGYHSPATGTGLDNSMEATAAPHHTVIRTSLRLQPLRYLLLPRLERRSRRFFRGSARLPVPVLVLPIPRSYSLAIVNNVSTPPQSHPPSLPHPLSAGLPCMVAITGDTLGTTPPYNSTPGDNIFKRQSFITGVCFLPCYTVCTCIHT